MTVALSTSKVAICVASFPQFTQVFIFSPFGSFVKGSIDRKVFNSFSSPIIQDNDVI